MNQPTGTFVALDTATDTEKRQQEEIKRREMTEAAQVERGTSEEAWLNHPLTQSKIAILKRSIENYGNEAARLSVDWELNKDKIRSIMNRSKAFEDIITILNHI